MIIKKFVIALLGAIVIFILLSCTSTAPITTTDLAPITLSSDQESLPAIYSKMAEIGGKVFTLNPEKSIVRIYAFRTGYAAQAGHNHVISAPRFTGFVYLPSSGLSGASFDLEFRLDQLEIDNIENRSVLGSGFSSNLPPEVIASTREHMLGAEGFQADRFPFVRIHSLEIAGEAPKLAVKVRIELHGKNCEMWIPLDVEGLPDQLSVGGSFVLRQTDFGVRPYTVLGGLLAVKDEVVIEFKLLGI